MLTPEVPAWWQDVHRALESALIDYATLLDALEGALSKETSHKHDELNRLNGALAAFVRRIGSARERLQRVLNLAQSRIGDAMASGLEPVPMALHTLYRGMISAHDGRAATVGKILQCRMTAVAEELNRRRSRPTQRRIFRNITPSHIDLRL